MSLKFFIHSEISRYLIIGTANVCVTYGLFSLFTFLFLDSWGIQGVYWGSSLLGLINGFYWQRRVVWKSHQRWQNQFLRFALVNIAVSCANAFLLYQFVTKGGTDPYLSQAIITIFLVIVSFLITKIWVFRNRSSANASMENNSSKRVDVFLQYYAPHISGLTIMASEIAEELAANGFDVHVHSISKKNVEFSLNGVTVHNYKKTFSIGRAQFSYSLFVSMLRFVNVKQGIAHVHLPYPESFLLALLLPKKWKIVSTYHCDAPKNSILNSSIAQILDWSNGKILARSTVISCTSEDYAANSRLSRFFSPQKMIFLPPTSTNRSGGIPKYRLEGYYNLGFLGRPTSEKGISVLLEALVKLPDKFRLVLAGPTEGLSEQSSLDSSLFKLLSEQGRITSLGFLEETEIPNFFSSIDVFVFPSTNSFEAFGIVQLEAISAGVPVISSNLPGVRTVVTQTKFGELFTAGQSDGLVSAIRDSSLRNYDFEYAQAVLCSKYSSTTTKMAYVNIFRKISG